MDTATLLALKWLFCFVFCFKGCVAKQNDWRSAPSPIELPDKAAGSLPKAASAALTVHCTRTEDEDRMVGLCRWISTSPSSLWIWRWSTPWLVGGMSAGDVAITFICTPVTWFSASIQSPDPISRQCTKKWKKNASKLFSFFLYCHHKPQNYIMYAKNEVIALSFGNSSVRTAGLFLINLHNLKTWFD